MDPLSPHDINPSWSISNPNSPETPFQAPSVLSPPPPLPPPSASSSIFAREPKVFGAPVPGLVGPPLGVANEYSAIASANGNAGGPSRASAQQGPYLRVRIGGLERNRKDLLIRFDASVSSSSSSTSTKCSYAPCPRWSSRSICSYVSLGSPCTDQLAQFSHLNVSEYAKELRRVPTVCRASPDGLSAKYVPRLRHTLSTTTHLYLHLFNSYHPCFAPCHDIGRDG